MAIHYARCEIVHAASDSSAAGLSAYISRSARRDNFTGTYFNFSLQADDLVHHEVTLPGGAPERLLNPEYLWNTAIERETTTDRNTYRVRFKKDAQAARHIVLALPKECSDSEREDLTRQFVLEHFIRFGVAVEWAIHRPDGDSENHHAHLLVTTRHVTYKGLGKKARAINPGFATTRRGRRIVSDQDQLADRWAEAQNKFFADTGIDTRVDPKRNVVGVHIGPSWHAQDSAQTEKAAAADAAAIVAMQDPATILRTITKQKASFTVRDLEKLVGKHGLTGEERDEAVKSAIEHTDIVRLSDPANPHAAARFTTKEVRAQEEQILGYANEIAARSRTLPANIVSAAAEQFTLDAEQVKSLRAVTSGADLSVLIGRAGTGKSRVLNSARIAFEAAGFSVRGLAPTNTAAVSLAEDGFTSASTLHRAMYRLANGSERWDRSTVCVVDEAALVDAEIYAKLVKAVADAGARLVLAGDDRQLSSVARGGIFSELTNRLGATELKRVRRQKHDWQREASQHFSRGDTASGLGAYSERGFLNWTATIDDSRARLLRDWSSNQDQEITKFIYASTNVEVDNLNALAHELRLQRGEIGRGQSFETKRGRIELSSGDRLQFYGNDRRAGILNGIVGTVKSVGPRKIEVITDAGATIFFDPETFKQWGLGYAGSVYRAQGKTKLRAFAFFDNPYAWNAKTAYVAMTRHTSEVRLYASRDLAPDEATLARLMARTHEDSASIRYNVWSLDQDETHPRFAALSQLSKRMGLSGRPGPNELSRPISVANGRSKRAAAPAPSNDKSPGRRPR